MKNTKKASYIVGLLVFMLCITTFPLSVATESTIQEKGQSTIQSILGLDTKIYSIQVTSYQLVESAMTADRGKSLGNSIQETATYSFKSADREVKANCVFINGTLQTCEINGGTGASLTTLNLPSNVLDACSVTLQRLQEHFGDSYIPKMLALVHNITEVKNTNTIDGNIRLQIETYNDYTDIAFKYTSQGLDYPKLLHIGFYRESLALIINQWDLYTIGSDTPKITHEEAIRIATEQAEKNATVLTFSDGSQIRYNLTGISDAKISSGLREPWTAYPFWTVVLSTDVYRGINQIQVGIWADTGTVAYCQASGVMADQNHPQTTPGSGTPFNETTTSATVDKTFVTAIILIAAIAIAIVVTLFVRKKPNNFHSFSFLKNRTSR